MGLTGLCFRGDKRIGYLFVAAVVTDKVISYLKKTY